MATVPVSTAKAVLAVHLRETPEHRTGLFDQPDHEIQIAVLADQLENHVSTVTRPTDLSFPALPMASAPVSAGITTSAQNSIGQPMATVLVSTVTSALADLPEILLPDHLAHRV